MIKNIQEQEMETITNTDIYSTLSKLLKLHQDSERTLSDYLSSLWYGCGKFQHSTGLKPGEFLQQLSLAFTGQVPEFSDDFLNKYRHKEPAGFHLWEARILFQINDLREMKKAGVFENDQKYFGVDAPSGARWYNFDPITYLECAAAGSIGGWTPEPDSGRMQVPGKVAVFNEEGEMELVEAEELEEPVVEIDEISWDDFTDFLEMGQMYE
ncbi:MAG: hypothetical protein GY754_12265 [bacterium]|nr:hypothetical protein [bacterium]